MKTANFEHVYIYAAAHACVSLLIWIVTDIFKKMKRGHLGCLKV